MDLILPCLFIPELIRKEVAPGRMGVYVLGNSINGEFHPMYVGRSDSCLQTRLLTHNHLYKYDYFIFKYVDDVLTGFQLEAKWWHDLRAQGHDLANKIHPDSPSGMACVSLLQLCASLAAVDRLNTTQGPAVKASGPPALFYALWGHDFFLQQQDRALVLRRKILYNIEKPCMIVSRRHCHEKKDRGLRAGPCPLREYSPPLCRCGL